MPIGISVAGPIARDATIDAGNSLVADTGLTGLSAGASAAASYSLSGISAGLTLGLIVTDDVTTINPGDNGVGVEAPGPLDRFFLADVDSIIEVTDVDVSANLDMVGRLGFLEVGAMVNGALTSPSADPALAIGITPSVGVTVDGTAVPNAILIRDVLSTDLVDLVTANIDLVFAGNASVSAAAAGLSASGGFDIDWDLDDPKPTISNFTTDYTNDLLPFGGDLELTQAGPADPGDATLFTGPATGPGAVNLLAEPGLVGSQLVDAAGNVCNITAVLSATQLNCSNADPASGVVNPIAFADGGTYDVAGNTLSKLADILAALDGLVVYLEQAVGDAAFDTQIDLIGVSPADIVGQIGELRRMIDEFRGVQDAYIDCVVQGDATADIRAIPLDTTPPGPPPDVTLQCAAESFGVGPTAVQWRIVPGDDALEPGPFVPDGDGDSISGSADPSTAFQALTVGAALDTNGDGFVAIGSEYSIEVEWTDASGDHQAAFPPRVPQSLQQLEDLINDTLGLPDGLLAFELATAPADPTLRINIGYGICSAQDLIPECDGLPTGPSPSANLNFDLSGAGLPDLVGLDVTGSIDVDYAALGQFDVGIPLTGASPVLYGTTGLEARLQVSGSPDLAVEASIGPVSALIGASATGGTDTAEADSTTTLTATGAFPASKVSTGMVITKTITGEACVISARTDDDNVECALDWTTGDEFEFGGRNDLNAGLAAEIQLTDTSVGGAVVADNAFVSFDDAGVDVPDLAEVLSGGTCGPIIEGEMTRVVGGAVDPAERPLNGLALCAALARSRSGRHHVSRRTRCRARRRHDTAAGMGTDRSHDQARRRGTQPGVPPAAPARSARGDRGGYALGGGFRPAVGDRRSAAHRRGRPRAHPSSGRGLPDPLRQCAQRSRPGRRPRGARSRPRSSRCSCCPSGRSRSSPSATTEAGAPRPATRATACWMCRTSGRRSRSATWWKRRPASISASRACRSMSKAASGRSHRGASRSASASTSPRVPMWRSTVRIRSLSCPQASNWHLAPRAAQLRWPGSTTRRTAA